MHLLFILIFVHLITTFNYNTIIFIIITTNINFLPDQKKNWNHNLY